MTKKLRSPNAENSQLCPRQFRHSDFVIPSDFVERVAGGRVMATSSGPSSRREGAIKSLRLVRRLGIRPLNGAAVGYIGRDGIPVDEIGGSLDDILTVGQALDLNSVLSIRQRQNGQS